jgi:hypothetical protein
MSVDDLLIQAIHFKYNKSLCIISGIFNCLVHLILFYWLLFSIVCPKGREGQTAIMKYEWDASLTFGLLSTWKQLIYVIGKKCLGAPQWVHRI